MFIRTVVGGTSFVCYKKEDGILFFDSITKPLDMNTAVLYDAKCVINNTCADVIGVIGVFGNNIVIKTNADRHNVYYVSNTLDGIVALYSTDETTPPPFGGSTFTDWYNVGCMCSPKIPSINECRRKSAAFDMLFDTIERYSGSMIYAQL